MPAASLHYSVDAGAQLMRGKLMQTVAVAFPYHPVQRRHFKDPFFMALIGSIGDALIDAVFACSDVMALTVMSALASQGLRVPEDVQVVGYDDVDLAAHAHPPLTTVRQSIEVAGKALVRLLLSKLSGQSVEPLVMPTALVVRASTRRAVPR